MPFVNINGLEIHYQLDGPPDAPVIAFAHSLGTDLSMWDEQAAALSQRFQVLRYDCRGHGRSSVTQGPYSVDLLGRDVVSLLDALNLDRVSYVGLSLGGLIGIWLGANASERLNRIALCNTAAKIGTPELWQARIEQVRSGGMKAISQAIVERSYSSTFRENEPAIVAHMGRMIERSDPAGYIACCEAISHADLRPVTKNITTPTLVIAGLHDIATPVADGQWLADHIDGAKFTKLDAGHLSNIEAPDAFTSTVSEFLEVSEAGENTVSVVVSGSVVLGPLK